jgi:hypothetical protein
MCVWVAVMLFIAGAAGVCSTPGFVINQVGGSSQVLIKVAKASEHRLEIDDAPEFRTPVWTKNFRGNTLEFDAYAAGLVPGILYYVRLHGAEVKSFRLESGEQSHSAIECSTLRNSWETSGRRMLELRSAVKWNGDQQRWEVSSMTRPEGQGIYYTELFVRSALESAQSCGDLRLYDEIAQYYLLMLQQTVELGAPAPWSASGRVRSFPAGAGQRGDQELGNVQWLYPAAKLVRLISLLPTAQRSATMQQFAAQYTSFIVDEQLLRFLLQPMRPAPGGGPDVSRIEAWNRTLRGLKGRRTWETAMTDKDLWLLASSAEMLGANANDPALASLTEVQRTQLHTALEAGIRLFRSKQTSYPDTRDLKGNSVGSASYFNGDYDDIPEYAGSGVSGPTLPAAQPKREHNLSWDTAHSYRIPVFLRALYESKKATKLDFPRLEELKLTANQYVYRVFNGDFSRPLFRNYLDGHDTWYRVGFSGPGSGYPPSEVCDMRSANRWCMAPGNIAGWGLLAFINPDLAMVERSLLRLAMDTSAESEEFRNRHYSYFLEPFQLLHSEGKVSYGATLFFIAADNAAMRAN